MSEPIARVIRWVSDDAIRVQYETHNDIWHKRILRRRGENVHCINCGVEMGSGQLAYRPDTYQPHRHIRMCLACADKGKS